MGKGVKNSKKTKPVPVSVEDNLMVVKANHYCPQCSSASQASGEGVLSVKVKSQCKIHAPKESDYERVGNVLVHVKNDKVFERIKAMFQSPVPSASISVA